MHPVGVALGGTGQWGYKDDYIPHHEPFDYYATTANPHHLTIPTDGAGHDSLAGLQTIGRDTQSYKNGAPQFDTPNHQYDTSDFDQLVSAIQNHELPASALPAVSFLKAPGYQDGHAAYSDPADEQQFVASEINALERTPDWKSTAVIVAYDDSDGWYDHQYPGVQNPSLSPADNLTNTSLTVPTTGTSGQCGPKPQTSSPLAGEQGRCGFGPRQPFVVDLAVREAQLRGPQPEQPGLGGQLRGVQLAVAVDRRLGRPDPVERRPARAGAVRSRRSVPVRPRLVR